jgi:MraZ protein
VGRSRNYCVHQMSANETSAPMYYNGVFTHGVDPKRRLQIPARWRPTKAGIELTIVVWPTSNGACLRVLPPEGMADLKKTIDDMPNSDPKKVVLKRFIGSQSAQVVLDAVGRVCIPDDMAKLAAITTEAVLVGSLDRFEIWSPDRHQKVQATDAVLAEEAFKLMG